MYNLGLILGFAASALALPTRNGTNFYSNSTGLTHPPFPVVGQGNKPVAISTLAQNTKPSPVVVGVQAVAVSVLTVTVTATPSSAPGYIGNGVAVGAVGAVAGGPAGSCGGVPGAPGSSPYAQVGKNEKVSGGSASSGYWSGETASSSHAGPVATLAPVVHWNIDTSKIDNVVPVKVGTGCPQYYAQGGVIGK